MILVQMFVSSPDLGAGCTSDCCNARRRSQHGSLHLNGRALGQRRQDLLVVVDPAFKERLLDRVEGGEVLERALFDRALPIFIGNEADDG